MAAFSNAKKNYLLKTSLNCCFSLIAKSASVGMLFEEKS